MKMRMKGSEMVALAIKEHDNDPSWLEFFKNLDTMPTDEKRDRAALYSKLDHIVGAAINKFG